MRLRNSTGAAAGKIILAGDRQHRPFEFLERSPENADYLSRSGEHHPLGASPNDGRSIFTRAAVPSPATSNPDDRRPHMPARISKSLLAETQKPTLPVDGNRGVLRTGLLVSGSLLLREEKGFCGRL